MNRTLWVEVEATRVYLRSGPKPPAHDSKWMFLMIGDRGIAKAEFERWSGLKLKPGYYGLRMTPAVVEKLRVVTETTVTKQQHKRLVRSK